MHDGHDIGTGLVDFRMYVALPILATAVEADSDAIQVILQNIAACDQFGSQRTRHEESGGVLVVSDAEMTVSVEDIMIGKNPVGGDQFFD